MRPGSLQSLLILSIKTKAKQVNDPISTSSLRLLERRKSYVSSIGGRISRRREDEDGRVEARASVIMESLLFSISISAHLFDQSTESPKAYRFLNICISGISE